MLIFSEKCECRPIIVTSSGTWVWRKSWFSYEHPKLQAVVCLCWIRVHRIICNNQNIRVFKVLAYRNNSNNNKSPQTQNEQTSKEKKSLWLFVTQLCIFSDQYRYLFNLRFNSFPIFIFTYSLPSYPSLAHVVYPGSLTICLKGLYIHLHKCFQGFSFQQRLVETFLCYITQQ